jgi:hypothetical protein
LARNWKEGRDVDLSSIDPYKMKILVGGGGEGGKGKDIYYLYAVL